MKLDVFDLTGKKTGNIEVSDGVFAREWNPDLVHQVFVSLQANARRPWAHAKTRDEVSGGGKKPWRQKGTGRARHGSTRSPIWVGGGTTHGPRNERDFSKKINKKMKQAAFYSVLSRKLADGELKVIDSITAPDGKTKALSSSLKGFFGVKIVPSTLLVASIENKEVGRASSNIPKIKALPGGALSLVDLLTYKNVLIEKEVVEKIA